MDKHFVLLPWVAGTSECQAIKAPVNIPVYATGLSAIAPILYIMVLEPLLCRLGQQNDTNLTWNPAPWNRKNRVSAYADDVTVFVFCLQDIEVVQKALVQYERVTGAKINRNKSEGLRFGAWRGGAQLLGPSNERTVQSSF